MKKIFDPDSIEVHKIWAKVQKKLGITTGDIDPLTATNFDKQIRENGMTSLQIFKFASNYYRKSKSTKFMVETKSPFMQMMTFSF